MIYAVPNQRYNELKAAGTLDQVQDEVQSDDTAALAARVANGELVEANRAERHATGERDRCYLCGDEVTPFHWREKSVIYFMQQRRNAAASRDCRKTQFRYYANSESTPTVSKTCSPNHHQR